MRHWRDEVRGRERDILRELGINWPSKGAHIQCPFPDRETKHNNGDKHPSWRWDDNACRYYCACGTGSLLDIVIRMGEFRISGPP